MIHHRPGVANKLIEPLRANDPLPFGIHIDTMGTARGLAIDGHDEANRSAVSGRTENEVQVARMEALDDAAILFVQERALIGDGPVAGERPLVHLRRARCINVAPILHHAARRDEMFDPVVADICFG
jgi:hypothetical protein